MCTVLLVVCVICGSQWSLPLLEMCVWLEGVRRVVATLKFIIMDCGTPCVLTIPTMMLAMQPASSWDIVRLAEQPKAIIILDPVQTPLR